MRSYQPNPPGQEFLHHAVLEGAGLVAAGFEGGQFGVHVGEDGGDGGLFGFGWRQANFEPRQILVGYLVYGGTQCLIYLPLNYVGLE